MGEHRPHGRAAQPADRLHATGALELRMGLRPTARSRGSVMALAGQVTLSDCG